MGLFIAPILNAAQERFRTFVLVHLDFSTYKAAVVIVYFYSCSTFNAEPPVSKSPSQDPYQHPHISVLPVCPLNVPFSTSPPLHPYLSTTPTSPPPHQHLHIITDIRVPNICFNLLLLNGIECVVGPRGNEDRPMRA